MKAWRSSFVLFLSTALFLTGCQSDSVSTLVEYRPDKPVAESHAPASEVYMLVMWQPIPPVDQSNQSIANTPPRQMTVEVEQVYVVQGQPLGFRKIDSQLIAVAGPTTKAVTESHYEWRTIAGQPSHSEEWGFEMQTHHAIVGSIVVVTVFVTSFAASMYQHG